MQNAFSSLFHHRRRAAIRLLFFLALLGLTWFPYMRNTGDWGDRTWFLLKGPALAAIVALLAVLPGVRALLLSLAGRLGRLRLTRPQWIGLISLGMLGLCTAGVWYIFGPVPVNPDAYAYYLQAKIFAGGEWYAESHPYRQFFNMQWVVNDGKYYSKYPPGYSMFLVPFYLLGITWLANPVSGMLCILAVYYLTAEIAGERAARIAALLTLGSQLIVVLASQYFNHALAAACATFFALFYIRMHKYRHLEDAVLAGASLGFLLIVRPQVAVPLALPFAWHWLVQARPPARDFWRCGLAALTMFSLWALFMMAYNTLTTGDPFTTGYHRYHGSRMPVLFHDWGNLREVYQQFRLVLVNLQQLHRYLFLWPTSSLWFVFLLFLLRLHTRYCGLLLAAIAALVVSLLWIPFGGGLPAARYLSEIAGLCIALSAVCIAGLPQWVAQRFPKVSEAYARSLIYGLLILLFAVGAASRFSLADTYRALAQVNFGWGKNPVYRDDLDYMVPTPALIFFTDVSYYTGSLYNPPDPDAPVIAARDRGPHNQKLMKMYPDRYVYLADRVNLTLVRKPLK